MKRKYLNDLIAWIRGSPCKPLVIRGARQVGKTWLVRQFAQIQGLQLIELNFEKRPELSSLFESNNPKQILLNLEGALHRKFDPVRSLLFLDEIQAMPELLAKLRWFAEDMPELAVIAAGSLLEFVLEKHTFSMPVGRINYMHMEPLSFEEFLLAQDKPMLLEILKNFTWDSHIAMAIHLQLMELFKEYIVIGGMPEVVASWVKERSLLEINQIQHALIATYRDDFGKYSGRIDKDRLGGVLEAVPKLLGKKFVYSAVNARAQSNTIKQSFDLLCKARVCHRVASCHANGLPLGAEIDEKFFKALFLDVGLCSAVLGLTLNQISSVNEISLINKGAIAEQVVGQLLRTLGPTYVEPKLFYWIRHEKGSSAEVDYVIQHEMDVIPIEVKAGTTGTLKSLHMFTHLKKRSKAIRIYSGEPNQMDVQVKDPLGNEARYSLLSIPFYLIGQLHRLLIPFIKNNV